METRFPSPTHQLGGDVLGEAHGSDAIRADHQQRDDDVDKGQPVGEVGPVGRALGQQSWIHAPTLSPVTPSCQQLLPAPNPPLLCSDSSTTAILNTHLYAFLSPLKPSPWLLAALGIKSNAAHSHWWPGLAAPAHLAGLLPLLLQLWEGTPCPAALGPLHMMLPWPRLSSPS